MQSWFEGKIVDQKTQDVPNGLQRLGLTWFDVLEELLISPEIIWSEESIFIRSETVVTKLDGMWIEIKRDGTITIGEPAA